MKTKIKKLMSKTLLVGPVLGAILGVGILTACTDNGIMESRDSNGVTTSQEISKRSGESGGEHGSAREGGSERGGGEHGGSGGESGRESGNESAASGSEEGSGANLAPDATFDAVRGGARLILNYDAAGDAFTGTVENTTGNALSNVRIEVHLSNGTELGPTTPVDMAPGEVLAVNLPSTQASFTGWIAHAEVGSGAEAGGEHASGSGSESGNESANEGSGESGGEGGESGPDGPEGPESGSEAAREAAMSSPITPLDQAWNGVLGGLAISAQYDAATQSVNASVQNTTSQQLCYVQSEPHLKSGTQTVGELGPQKLGDLNPGQTVMSSLSVIDEPSLAGVAYDGYVIHMEVFDCGGPGPVAHTGAEGSGEHGGSGGEGHGPGGEGGNESGGASGNEEGSGATLALDETFDATRGGARLIMNYDAAGNAFTGTVENTTNNTLSNVRIEVHLSNGTELGPTIPVDMAPGEVYAINMPATQEAFTGWIAHAEVGSGEGGGEHGSGSGSGEGSESGSGESGGEHGSGSRESGRESGESGSEEGSRAILALDETFDATRGGARLVMGYDAASNAFNGIVENTTNNTLNNVRIEVHLSNGTELGPTIPVDMAPGEMYAINMPATQEPFTGWIAHAEVGSGEHGSGSGSGEGNESGGRESGGEHGSSRESGGEHGGRGERRGGG